MADFIKLSELDGESFSVQKTYGFCFKKWDEANRKMLVEDNWNETMKGDRNWRKIYAVDTNRGRMDLSERQLKDMLGGVYSNGVADINGRTFTVKKYVGENNIPTYYINPTKDAPKKVVDDVTDPDEISKEDLDALGW